MGRAAAGLCYRWPVVRSGRLILAALLLALVGGGCGYHLVGTTSSLPEDVKTLFLERFQNRSSWIDMDQRLDEALSLEWVRRRRLQLLDDRGSADLVLSGVILNLNTTPVSFDETGRANEYQMTLTSSVQLHDVRGEEPRLLWEDIAFSRRTSYVVDPRSADFFDRQILAMDRLAEEYARGLVSAVLEGF
jgi:outer membrane lipopolysaccharide assembly protein LptE/RlpB